MTFVTFIEVLNNGSFKKVVETSSRTAEKFCLDACEYYARKGIETEVRCSTEDPRFVGVFSCKNDKLMAVAGPEKNTFFWRKHTLVKKNVEEANGEYQKPANQKWNFYAVISVDFTGFVRTWDECKKYTHGKSAKFKGFNGIEQAKTWMRENNAASAAFEHYTDLKQIK